MHALDGKARKLRAERVDTQVLELGDEKGRVEEQLDTWARSSFARRLWRKDPTLWFDEPRSEIVDRLGWLTLPQAMHEVLDDLRGFADEVQAGGFRHVLLMGMGGSSLAPELYQRTFSNRADHPELIVLDSTHPDAVAAVDARIDPTTTLFLLASKSGTTLEPLSFFRYFWHRASAATGSPGDRFAAITDPGTPLVDLAAEHDFRRVFEATPDVGGRYSALTVFGLVPAALIGVDVHRLLDRAGGMADAAAFYVPERSNPALALGAALGVLTRHGVDKATFLASPSLSGFPAWAEQLVAESTGKDGTGVLPVADEPVGPPEVYDRDRFFVYLSYVGDDDPQAEQVDALERAGHPVARIRLYEKEDLGGELFRAEVAVAAAGAVLGIHPFDQPDVQLAKDLARRAMAGELETGPVEEIPATLSALAPAAADWLGTLHERDYVAVQAYLRPTAETTAALQRLRTGVRDRHRVATTVGYGPRFLHSTGQFHKGGPDSGLFLQLVDVPGTDLAVPGTDYGFGELIAAQALGDYQALRERGRRVLRVALGADVAAGLAALEDALHG